MNKHLRLYVWPDVFTDYTSGIAFALAPSADEARKLINRAMGCDNLSDLLKEPHVYNSPVGFGQRGGG